MKIIDIFSEIGTTYSYNDYRNLVVECSDKNETTGNEKLPERIEATRINAQRMKRLDKQIILDNKIIELTKNSNEKWLWFVLSESWCGDGAQNIPVIAKIASVSLNIELKIILRDEHPEIMNSYLTNGSRSIPKLICINAQTNEEIGTWGSRPAKIQQMVKEYKAQNPDVSHDEFVKNLHLWYAKDKGESLQKDFEQLISKWSSR